MPNKIRHIQTQEVDEEHQLVVDLNVDIPLKEVRGHTAGLVRGNVYRNKGAVEANSKQPVLVTYAPYGKDVPYSSFNKRSYDELPEGQKSKWSAWEVPEVSEISNQHEQHAPSAARASDHAVFQPRYLTLPCLCT